MKSYIYLACPYTAYKADGSLDEDLMEERYQNVLNCFASLIKAGLVVFCPIAMTHTADQMNNRMYPNFWYEFDKAFIQNMSQLFILKLQGWEKSIGLQEEIKTAIERRVPITYLEYIK